MPAKFLYIMLLVLACSAVAAADVFIKKAGSVSNFSSVLKNPWMIGAILLYFFQIYAFAYLFSLGLELAYVGIMQVILYTTIIVASSVILFHETFTVVKMMGLVLGFAAVILMNI